MSTHQLEKSHSPLERADGVASSGPVLLPVGPPLYLSPQRALQPLRICIVASASLPIPPWSGYGGTQRGIHDLVVTLRARGHHVTLCGPGDSTTPADELIAPLPRSLWSHDSPYPVEQRGALAEHHVREVCAALRQRDFDLINVRYDHQGLLETLCREELAPLVYSLHNVADARTRPIVEQFGGRVHITAHCESHRAQYPRSDLIDVVFYGMDVAAYPFGAAPLATATEAPTLPVLQRLREARRDYLVIIGRIAREKGQRSAIEVARRAGLPLIIVGEPFTARDAAGAAYWQDEVAPFIDGENVIAFGQANEDEKRELVRFARAALLMSGLERPEWQEPFGRVVMEALASGTPVIAHAHGSAPEILAPAVGYLCHDVDAMVEAATRVSEIDRAGCRRHALEHLSRERMAVDYEALFRRVAGQRMLRPTRSHRALAQGAGRPQPRRRVA